MAFDPVEPPASLWDFSLGRVEPGEDLVIAGGDLAPGTVLAAYRHGLFPMGLGRGGREPIGWWSPDPRGVLLPGGVHVSRSLRRSVRRVEVLVDTSFEAVVAGCADRRREGRWITERVAGAYTELHRLGWAHSIEVWHEGRLVGGLYGLAIGGLFAGESMFHRERDASKVALLALTERFFADADPRRLLDVQWSTAHLAGLGVVEVSRPDYLRRLAAALEAPQVHFD